MKIMLETTQWADSTPNHVYVFTDNMQQITAYLPEGSRKVQKFKQPIAIDRRGRTFVELASQDNEPKPDVWTVEGSKGKIYTITREPGGGLNYQCTCPGYTYRGSCRHVAEMQQTHAVDLR